MNASGSALPVYRDTESIAHATCATCPSLCRSACPVAEELSSETVAPRNLMVQASLLSDGRLSPARAERLSWACTGCGACEEACLHDNEVPFWLLLARHRLREAGYAPPEASEAAASFGVAGNAFGVSLEAELETVTAAAETRSARTARDLYLPGCVVLHGLPEVGAGLLRGARRRGWGELAVTKASEHCCGAPLAWAGELEGFVAHARRYARELNGARRVIVHDPPCAHTLRVLYPRFGVRIEAEVVTITSFLLGEARGGQPEPSGPRYAWLEPCHLGRGLHEREGPVALLDSVLGARWTPLEPGGVDCCGAAGLFPDTHPSAAKAMAKARIATFRDTGADRLLTASPRCARHLLDADPSLAVSDLAVLVGGEPS